MLLYYRAVNGLLAVKMMGFNGEGEIESALVIFRPPIRFNVASVAGHRLSRRHDRCLPPASADVYAVLGIDAVEGFTRWPPSPQSERPSHLFVDQDLESLRLMAERLNRSEVLSDLLDSSLQLLEELFGFHHAMTCWRMNHRESCSPSPVAAIRRTEWDRKSESERG